MVNGASGPQLKLDCPKCGGEVPIPFHRGNLESRKHYRGGRERDCRFMVSVDPIGDDHRFRLLERTERFEEVWTEMWEAHRERVKAAIFAECLAQTKEGWAA